ncbi:MAG TPA: hypothetical protein PLC15_20965 [Candidatus Obscuribacter sp.]|nr:hypothetical protein [Candidatus Obscuribacter sp.]HNH74098.1 hypothetical protein [Candidatus Obscuribacter sp.]
MQILGIVLMVIGAIIWCGNVFGFMPTFPLAGYLTIALGAFLSRKAKAGA